MTRREHDFYPTPEWMTRLVLPQLQLSGLIREPCNGDGAISKVLVDRGLRVITSDIDPARNADEHFDAAAEARPCDWMVTNPPFSHATEIVERWFPVARCGVVCLLRLSFAEPTDDKMHGGRLRRGRREFLMANPYSLFIPPARVSFTGDGGKDSVTTAWFMWEHGQTSGRIEYLRVEKNSERLEQPKQKELFS